jgi:hypothetical protein
LIEIKHFAIRKYDTKLTLGEVAEEHTKVSLFLHTYSTIAKTHINFLALSNTTKNRKSLRPQSNALFFWVGAICKTTRKNILFKNKNILKNVLIT